MSVVSKQGYYTQEELKKILFPDDLSAAQKRRVKRQQNRQRQHQQQNASSSSAIAGDLTPRSSSLAFRSSTSTNPGDYDAIRRSAIAAINGELNDDEDPHVTAPKLLASCRHEAVEARKSMASIASAQIAEAYRALAKIKQAKERAVELQSSFMEQGELIQGMQTAACYKQMKKLNVLRTNIRKIIEWTEALKKIHHNNYTKQLTQKRYSKVYDSLKKALQIRKALQESPQVENEQLEIFAPYFSKLDVMVQLFAAEMKDMFADCVMVAILRAVSEYEEETTAPRSAAAAPSSHDDDDEDDNEDLPEEVRNFNALTECIQICADEVATPLLKVDGDDECLLRKDLVKAWVLESVSNTWVEEVMGDVTDPIGQLSQYLEQMKKVEQIIQALDLMLVPLSSTFPMFGIVVDALHGEVIRVMYSYVKQQSRLEAEKILQAIQFLRWYKEMLEVSTLYPYVNPVDRSALADHEDEHEEDEEEGSPSHSAAFTEINVIVASLMKAAVSGLSRHMQRLCKACAMQTLKGTPKQMPNNGILFTPGPVDLFTILRQSINAVSSSVEQKVMQQVGASCVDGITAYVQECMEQLDYDLMDDDNRMLATPKPEKEWTEDRIAKVYAFCNDTVTIEQNIESVEVLFAASWSADIEETPFQNFLAKTLPDSAEYYLDEIVAHVNRLVNSEWKKLFVSSEWLATTAGMSAGDDESLASPLGVILVTLGEFLDEDFSHILHEQFVKRLTTRFMNDSFKRYLNMFVYFLAQTASSAPHWKTQDDLFLFGRALERDADLLRLAWEDRVTGARKQIVDSGAMAVKMLRGLIVAPSAEQFADFLHTSFLNKFPDCPSFIVEFIMTKRCNGGELAKDNKAAMMDTWKEKIGYQRRGANDVFTGTSQGQSFLGGVDRSLVTDDGHGKRGFFSYGKAPTVASKLAKKEAEEAKKRAEEKEEKRRKRDERKKAAKAEASAGQAPPPAAAAGGNSGGVEVMSLDELLR